MWWAWERKRSPPGLCRRISDAATGLRASKGVTGIAGSDGDEGGLQLTYKSQEVGRPLTLMVAKRWRWSLASADQVSGCVWVCEVRETVETVRLGATR